MLIFFLWIALTALLLLSAYLQFRMYRLRLASRNRDELFQIVTENAADMIALVDMKGQRLYNSPSYKRILGYSPVELSETSAFDQIHPDDRFLVLEAARAARETGVGKKLEYRMRHKDGSWRVLESAASAIRDAKGEVAKLVIVNRDVTDRRLAEERLEHTTFHDTLTGLPNRRLFLDRLERLFVRAQRGSKLQHAVLFVDLDGFKNINSRLGHEAGDALLVEIGKRLPACLRRADSVARPEDRLVVRDSVVSRFGGDEFTILLEEIGDASDAMRVAKRIQTALEEPLVAGKEEMRPGASIGIAVSSRNHERAEELLQEADVAMRRAKSLGGGRCEVFDEAMHTLAVTRLKLEGELRVAMAQKQFRVYYHPIMMLDNRRIVGFEALLRWQHPAQGLITPFKFLKAAEDIGLLAPIGKWLIAEACKQLATWQAKNPFMGPVTMAVNLSGKQLLDDKLVGDLQMAMRTAGIAPAQLHLEITESMAAVDPKLTVAVLAQLKQVGIGVILDDFGTGHCSLSRLRQLSVDALKIDRTLTTEMLSDRGANDIVALVITLAHKMNLKVIAEGIESVKQLERLRELGCEMGQGYLFSRPVAADSAEQLLRQQRTRAASPGS